MKLVVTAELGRLARWLRILGFDTVVFAQRPRRELVLRSLKEDRVIATRDSRMSRFTGVRMLHIRSDFIEEQLEQVIRELHLAVDTEKLFSICIVCNRQLEEAPRQTVKEKVPPFVFEKTDRFMICPGCRRIYWKGTHWALAKKFLERHLGSTL